MMIEEHIKVEILKLKNNIKNIYREINNLIQKHQYEINNDPCYKPKTKNEIESIIKKYNINIRNIKEIKNRFFENYSKLNLIDDYHNMLIFLFIYISAILNNKQYFQVFCDYYAIRFYGNLLHKNLKYCQPQILELTFKHAHGSHLYKQKGIYSSIKHTSDNMISKYFNTFAFKEPKRKDIINFIYGLRHRISQQMKYFLTTYYKIDEDLNNTDSKLYKNIISDSIMKKFDNIIPEIKNTFFSYSKNNLNQKFINEIEKQFKVNTYAIIDILNDIYKNITTDEFNRLIYFSFKPIIDNNLDPVSYLLKNSYEKIIIKELTTRSNTYNYKDIIIDVMNNYIQNKEKIENLTTKIQRYYRIFIGIYFYYVIINNIISNRYLYSEFFKLKKIYKKEKL